MKDERGGKEGVSGKGGPSKCLVSYHPVVQAIAYECRAIERSVSDPRRRRTSSRRRRRDGASSLPTQSVCVLPDMRRGGLEPIRLSDRLSAAVGTSTVQPARF